jgi:hypothetical protein
VRWPNCCIPAAVPPLTANTFAERLQYIKMKGDLCSWRCATVRDRPVLWDSAFTDVALVIPIANIRIIDAVKQRR